jgi:signal peptide peptidase SppA
MSFQTLVNTVLIVFLTIFMLRIGQEGMEDYGDMEDVHAEKQEDTRPTISIIKLHGAISSRGGISLSSIRKLISKAFKPVNLKMVVLDIDCPGGDSAETEMVGAFIKFMAKKRDVEVIAYVGGMATSGGYWLACMADRIYAAETSVIGSIGVILHRVELTGTNPESLEKEGLELRTFASSEEKKKSSNETVTALLSITFDIFKAVVKESRDGKIKDEEETFSGKVWLARRALELGLIDGFRYLDVFLSQEVGDDDSVRILRVKRSKKNAYEKLLGMHE